MFIPEILLIFLRMNGILPKCIYDVDAVQVHDAHHLVCKHGKKGVCYANIRPVEAVCGALSG